MQNGDVKAADFLEQEFRKNGLQPLRGDYRQPFTFNVNVIKKTPKLIINGKPLVAGRDFIVGAESPSGKGNSHVITIRNKPPETKWSADTSGRIFFIDIKSELKDSISSYTRQWKMRPIHPRCYVFAEDKLTWTARQKQFREPGFNVLRNVLPDAIKKIKYEVKSELISHQAYNITATVPGIYADSFIFITAHYDHLGRMGDVIFPGANDNASGTSMLMDLAKTYACAKDKPKYTMVFVGFAGEEAGLIGSEYMANHPPVPLANIRFLLNLDLMGSGDEGLSVVNGLKFKEEFAILDSINSKEQLLVKLNQGGEAKNSDHYHFTEKGVHSFFCFTLGGSKAYHDIYDRCEVITLSRYPQVFTLLKKFLDQL